MQGVPLRIGTAGKNISAEMLFAATRRAEKSFRHSRIGGFRIERISFGLYLTNHPSKARTAYNKRVERVGFDKRKTCESLALSIVEFVEEGESLHLVNLVILVVARHFRDGVLANIERPSVEGSITYGTNVKRELRTMVDGNATGSRTVVVQKKRRGRAESQLQQNEHEAQKIRIDKMKTVKLFLCNARCPVTNRYCRKEYLSGDALCRHQAGREEVHDFPDGFNTETKLAMVIGQPGGVMAGGNLPDRLSQSAIVDCFELLAGAPGSVAARCHGKFNRPRRTDAYYKPKRLRAELNKLFKEQPVVTPQLAWLRLRDMRETDGTRTFSVSQAGSVKALSKGTACTGCGKNPCDGCRGKLIPVMDIKSGFSSQARKRKASTAS